jgi:two-component system, chemotaxis family, chemotaxis protein CheY
MILVVDDEPDVREGLSLALEMEGYIVVQAANGQEALERLKNFDRLPLLIVLDLTMPILDGRGFLEQRARDRILADIPVIVVSGSKPDEVFSDVEAFLQKPVEIVRLLESISHIEARREH